MNERTGQFIALSQSLDSELLPLICRLADGELDREESASLMQKVQAYPELAALVEFLQLLKNIPEADKVSRAKHELDETEVAYRNLIKRINEEDTNEEGL